MLSLDIPYSERQVVMGIGITIGMMGGCQSFVEREADKPVQVSLNLVKSQKIHPVVFTIAIFTSVWWYLVLYIFTNILYNVTTST